MEQEKSGFQSTDQAKRAAVEWWNAGNDDPLRARHCAALALSDDRFAELLGLNLGVSALPTDLHALTAVLTKDNPVWRMTPSLVLEFYEREYGDRDAPNVRRAVAEGRGSSWLVVAVEKARAFLERWFWREQPEPDLAPSVENPAVQKDQRPEPEVEERQEPRQNSGPRFEM